MSNSKVLVTGANGFIAAHCIALLLRSNFLVRATVRSSEKATATRTSLTAGGVDCTHLEIAVVPDPTDLAQFALVVGGCQAILHLASAFNYDAKPGEFEEKLLLPALKGTRTVCEAAAGYADVKKVLIMSSFASVYEASLGLQPGRVYTENDWCSMSYEDGRDTTMVAAAYRASKVIAEKAAWDFIHDHEGQFQLITLCPGMVFGEMIHPISSLAQLNASNQIVWEVLRAGETGELPPTRAPVWIDVQDLALTALRALTASFTTNERFLVTQGAYDTQEIADIIREKLPEKRNRIPVGEPGKYVAATHYSCDSSKVQRMLGVKFRLLEESIVPLAKQLYSME